MPMPKTVILLQIVVVCLGIHPVKNHESQSITNESQLKKKQGVNRPGPLSNQTVNLGTNSKTLYTV